ncbi:RNA exonuclease 4-like [Leguminivora glycinivorella]|uniref:RNA exonuclease 4-like n=1 Tax=Leguminivora glycinivorella TaxID=1035111 RepID=UPI0020109FE6|nr:RNA exonuclease 4-like [Leguminivora glycinivorella]
MANQEFENGLVIMIVNVILICIAALVAVAMISFFIECVSRIWSSLFSGPPEAPNYNVPTLRAETHVNRPNYYLGTNITRETKRVVAIDTECVGAGFKGSQSMLARVSLVNRNGQVYDTFVKPTMPVTDYRTFVSGIRRGDLEDAADYLFVRMSSTKPSLKYLAKKYLYRDIQVREHCSIEDAQAAMDLYQLVEEQWEKEMAFY